MTTASDGAARADASGFDAWWGQADQLVEALDRAVPGLDLTSRYDPAAFGPAMARLAFRLGASPGRTIEALSRFLLGTADAAAAATRRAVGVPAAGPVADPPQDRRFADPAWELNAAYFALRQEYLLLGRFVEDLLAAAELEAAPRQKVEFVLRQLLDAAAPTNVLLGNPAAVKHAFDTGGLSVVRGLRTFLDDLVNHGGRPRQTVPGRFVVGRDLAATPGKVVYRNELMELLQYAPQTDAVHEIPLLLSPPWINKYYMMDLAPGRSLVEWAVQHGLTVFAISYRNPDESMRHVAFDDYLVDGPRRALDVIEDITGSRKVNVLGLCLGGTLTMATLAYLATVGDRRVNTGTLLNTLVDFSQPGPLGVFTDPATVDRLDRRMARSGFLTGTDMRSTFDLLRSNDLIWGYVVNNWLMGKDPKPFDLLAWNDDSTRMPAGMHSFYLRSCYLDNQLARGEMVLAGERIDLGAVTEDLYFVAAEQDHIAPWRSVYAGAQLTPGKVRFVLSNSGHIAGVVNPPNPKSKHWVLPSGALPRDPDRWRQRAQVRDASWWEDWTPWIATRSGESGPPPGMGSRRHPPLADAPGTYVHES